eukprot:1447825-Amphidinium_carterae.1
MPPCPYFCNLQKQLFKAVALRIISSLRLVLYKRRQPEWALGVWTWIRTRWKLRSMPVIGEAPLVLLRRHSRRTPREHLQASKKQLDANRPKLPRHGLFLLLPERIGSGGVTVPTRRHLLAEGSVV